MPFSLHYIRGYLISTWFITADVKVRKCLLGFTNVKVLFTPFCSTFFGHQSWSPCCTKTKLHLLEGEYPHVLLQSDFKWQNNILFYGSALIYLADTLMSYSYVALVLLQSCKESQLQIQQIFFKQLLWNRHWTLVNSFCVPLSFCFLRINSWFGIAGSKDKHIFKAFDKHN